MILSTSLAAQLAELRLRISQRPISRLRKETGSGSENYGNGSGLPRKGVSQTNINHQQKGGILKSSPTAQPPPKTLGAILAGEEASTNETQSPEDGRSPATKTTPKVPKRVKFADLPIDIDTRRSYSPSRKPSKEWRLANDVKLTKKDLEQARRLGQQAQSRQLEAELRYCKTALACAKYQRRWG